MGRFLGALDWLRRSTAVRVEEDSPYGAGWVLSNVNRLVHVFGNRIEKSVDADGDGPQTATVIQHAYENGNAWADFDDNGDLATR